jgi:hypothetical protein
MTVILLAGFPAEALRCTYLRHVPVEAAHTGACALYVLPVPSAWLQGWRS